MPIADQLISSDFGDSWIFPAATLYGAHVCALEKPTVLLADPPWSYQDKSLNRGGAERHYDTLDQRALCDLPVAEIAADNSILFLWTTFPMLPEALQVVDAWGFKYKTAAFTWVKRNKLAPSWFWGMGRWTRSNAEVCLLATRGAPSRAEHGKGVHSIIDAPVMKHSAKPQETKERIVTLTGDVTRLELFAREVTPGWHAVGNEVNNGADIRDVLPAIAAGLNE
jgi:N6-adenosine-specific RNA methylase IME4